MSADFASVLVWREELGALEARLGELFVRAEPRRQAGLYLEGLLSAAKRKNDWQLAEQIGDARTWRTQRVLSHVLWDQHAARDLCRDYVLERLGAPDGVLIVDETGFLKKGEHSAGAARQYSGTAGRIENAQIGVFLAYASSKGHALIDRELYLPEEWCDDAARRDEAAIPEAVTFATKPALAGRMIGCALDAGLSCAWAMRSTTRTAGCGWIWNGASSPLCSLSAATRSSGRCWMGTSASMPRHAWPPAYQPEPGDASQRGQAAKGNGSMIGSACALAFLVSMRVKLNAAAPRKRGRRSSDLWSTSARVRSAISSVACSVPPA